MKSADLRALEFARAELLDREQWASHPDRARALQLLDALLDRQTTEPVVFRRDRTGWRVGSGEGDRISPPSDAIGSALSTLYAAVASPCEPRVVALDPAQRYADPLSAARKRITLCRQFLGDRCPALGEILKHVVVTQDDQQRPVAVFYPPPGMRPVIIR